MTKSSNPVAGMAHVKQLTGSSLGRNTGSPRGFEGLKQGLKGHKGQAKGSGLSMQLLPACVVSQISPYPSNYVR